MLLKPSVGLAACSLLIISCEDDEGDPFNPTGRQPALVEGFLAGDTYTRTQTSNFSENSIFPEFAIADSVETTLEAGVVTQSGTQTLTYINTGEFTFRFTLETVAGTTLDSTLDAILADSVLGTELRSLLLVADLDGDGVVDPLNVARIGEILNDAGNDLQFNPNTGGLFFATFEVFDHAIQSNQQTAVTDGIISGDFRAEAQGLSLEFRDGLSSDSRFFGDSLDSNAEFVVPTFDGANFVEVNPSQEGTFVIRLVNINEPQ